MKLWNIGYEGIKHLEQGDYVHFKIGADELYSLAMVTESSNTLDFLSGVYIELKEDYNGKKTKFKKGEKILAGALEIYIGGKLLD